MKRFIWTLLAENRSIFKKNLNTSIAFYSSFYSTHIISKLLFKAGNHQIWNHSRDFVLLQVVYAGVPLLVFRHPYLPMTKALASFELGTKRPRPAGLPKGSQVSRTFQMSTTKTIDFDFNGAAVQRRLMA